MTPAEKLAKQKPTRKAAPHKTGVWSCRCRGLRLHLRLSIRDVAQAVGLSVGGLHQIEHGGDLRLTTACKLADFYGIDNPRELWTKPDEVPS